MMKYLSYPHKIIYSLFFVYFILPFVIGDMFKLDKLHLLPLRLPLWLITWSLAVVSYLLSATFKSRSIQQYAFGLDQATNALLGGYRDETVSSVIGRRIKNSIATKAELLFCNYVSSLDNETTRHCVNNIGN